MSVDQDRERDEDPQISRSARNARQGRPGRPVGMVLTVSLALVVIGMALAYAFFFV